MLGPRDEPAGRGAAARPAVSCPGCGYVPMPWERWVCAPDGCGHSWDTFATAARCPGCGAQFAWTVCPSCHRSFAHQAWYRDRARPG